MVVTLSLWQGRSDWFSNFTGVEASSTSATFHATIAPYVHPICTQCCIVCPVLYSSNVVVFDFTVDLIQQRWMLISINWISSTRQWPSLSIATCCSLSHYACLPWFFKARGSGNPWLPLPPFVFWFVFSSSTLIWKFNILWLFFFFLFFFFLSVLFSSFILWLFFLRPCSSGGAMSIDDEMSWRNSNIIYLLKSSTLCWIISLKCDSSNRGFSGSHDKIFYLLWEMKSLHAKMFHCQHSRSENPLKLVQ